MSMLVIAMLWLRYDRQLHSEGRAKLLGVQAELWILVLAIVRLRVAVLGRRCAHSMGAGEESLRIVLVAPLVCSAHDSVCSAAPWSSCRGTLVRDHVCLRHPWFNSGF